MPPPAAAGSDPTALGPATRGYVEGPEHAMTGSTKIVMTSALSRVDDFMTDLLLHTSSPNGAFFGRPFSNVTKHAAGPLRQIYASIKCV
jgi:hypothetical protein